MDYTNCCRTCLSTEKETRPINSSIMISGMEVPLPDILEKFYDYKVTQEPSYPNYICISCVYQLTITYSFKLLIESTQKTLRDNLNAVELSSDIYDCSQDSNQTVHKVKLKRKLLKCEQADQKIKTLFCVECKAEFDSIQVLKDHCNDHHPVKRSVGRDCQYCFEKFEDFRSFLLHRKLHFKPFLCENCWVGFYTEMELNAHICEPTTEIKIKKDKKLRQCDQCGKSYQPDYFRVHLMTHGSDRRYSCSYCPKRFKVPGSLNSHILWNHKRTRSHKCEICNATFISSSARSSHIRKNHLKEKKYSCDSCGKRFFSKSELQRHILTHTGVKNFHCHMCDKSYQTRYGLNVHLKSHSQMSMNVLTL